MTAPERPEGVPETAQPVTVTLWVEPEPEGRSRHVYWPSGFQSQWTTDTLNALGIPHPPRVGPLGLSEEETRDTATWPTYEDTEPPRVPVGECPGWDTFILACRAAVAAWDAEDAS